MITKKVSFFFVFRYVYVYLEYIKQPITDDNTDENFQCLERRTVSLQRTGTIKIVTISALISHFLPYFNSSINPIIYNIMSGKTKKYFDQISIFFFFYLR
jgi:hypothetical protein